MIALRDEHIDFIARDLRQKGIHTPDLQDNLLDHICCILETEMSDLGEFDSRYPEVLTRFYKNNLSEIEDETLYLQTFKHYYAMKKTMIWSGAVSTFAISVGAFFKMMHYPGSNVLLVTGIVIFSLLFLPLLLTLKLRESGEKRDRIVLLLGLLTGILASMSVLFKLMWWPGANVLRSLSLLSLILVFVPVYFITGIRQAQLKVNTIVTSILLLSGGAMLFSLSTQVAGPKTQVSLQAIEQNLQDNLLRLKKHNADLASRLTKSPVVHKDTREKQDKALELITKLSAYLEEMNTHVLAKSLDIPENQAVNLSLDQIASLKPTGDATTLLENDPSFSFNVLEAKVNAFNEAQAQAGLATSLQLNSASFQQAQLPVLLHSLRQLAYETEVERNGLLNYLSGTAYGALAAIN